MKSFLVEELNEVVGGVLVGNTTQKVVGIEQMELADSNHLAFIGHKKYLSLWEKSKACVAIINEELKLEPDADRALIKVKNVDLSMAKLLELFKPDAMWSINA